MEAGRTFREPAWFKACNGGNCVEVAGDEFSVALRDSADGEDAAVITISRETWTSFRDAVKAGRFDHI